MGSPVDEGIWVEAGLLDPSSPTADERRALLAWFASIDIPLDRMVEACQEGQLTSLAGDLALRPGDRFTLDELAARTGVDHDFAVELRTASGFPPTGPGAAVYTDDDVLMFRLFQIASDLFSRDELLHFTRVLGTSVRRVAEAAGEMFMRDVEAVHMEDGSTELERAQTNRRAIELARQATGLFDPMFRSHVDLATRATRRARAHHHDYDTVPLTVGFVDLTGFTERAGSSTPLELLRLVTRFEATAHDLVTAHGGRLVKLIGDEVMFATVDVASACAIACGLTAATDVSARGGLAFGEVVTSGGDLYGPTVNLASRIADVAIAGEVLVNDAVVDLVAGAALVAGADLVAGVSATYSFEPAGRRQLKGFAEPVRLWSLAAG